MTRFIGPLLSIAMLFSLACQDYVVVDQDGTGDPTKKDAQIEVTPPVLDFGQLVAGEEVTKLITIKSIGGDTLYLEDMFVDGPISFSLDDGEVERILAPDASTTLPVTYAPMADEEATGEVHILSSDRDTPDSIVDLTATGLAPMIELNPATFDFGDDEIGCDKEQEIEIWNMGSAPLQVDEVVFAPTSDEMLVSFYFQEGTFIDPGQMQTATVYYRPRDELPDTGYLHIYSNDPAHPDALATQYGTAHLADEVTDEYEQEGNNWTDILWVVDNSCSMGDEQNSLAINFSSFLDIIEVLDIDYHIAVATTDNGHFQGAVPIMTPSTPDVAAAFADAVNVGTGGSGIEKGFQYGQAALSPPLMAPGGPNDGFMREEAGLRLIFVSDESEQSQDTVTAFTQFFQGLKTNPDHMIASSITGQLTGCSSPTGNADPAPRYEQITAATGGLSASICDPNWVNTLSNLAWLSLSWQDTFELSEYPVEETIEVELNHVPVYVGWYFDEVINAVIFDPDYIPDTGDLITINYNILGTCEG